MRPVRNNKLCMCIMKSQWPCRFSDFALCENSSSKEADVARSGSRSIINIHIYIRQAHGRPTRVERWKLMHGEMGEGD